MKLGKITHPLVDFSSRHQRKFVLPLAERSVQGPFLFTYPSALLVVTLRVATSAPLNYLSIKEGDSGNVASAKLQHRLYSPGRMIPLQHYLVFVYCIS